MADYPEELKTLSKYYVRAYTEHAQAGKIASVELKPFKNRLEKQKLEVDGVFKSKNWTCVKDPISGLYVTRTRVATPKPLTKDLMDDILKQVESFEKAKFKSWKNVKHAIDETLALFHSMRLSDKFTVSVKAKPPTTKTKVVDMQKEGLGQYNQWLHSFVAAHRNLKEKEDNLKVKKKALGQKFKSIQSQVEDIYRQNHYVSIPIKFERKISPEFQDVVVMTGSNYLSKKLPRKIKRYLEYIPVTKRNTTVKKFSPGKKEVTNYLTDKSKTIRSLRELNLKKLIQHMFDDLQEKAKKANSEKLQKAKAEPEYKLKVSEKKTMTSKPNKPQKPQKPQKRKAEPSSHVKYKRR